MEGKMILTADADSFTLLSLSNASFLPHFQTGWARNELITIPVDQ